jgi:hypothetical protein
MNRLARVAALIICGVTAHILLAKSQINGRRFSDIERTSVIH